MTVTAGPAPNGNCVVAGSFPLKTKVTVTEQIPSGDYVTAIRVTPSSSEISGSANLTTGTVKARINGATTVTYTDVGSGTLKICKVAGMGVSVGTPFTFSYTTVSGSGTVTVPAGPAPGGYCVVAGTSRYGAYTVTENATSPPTYVTGITAVPPGTANGMTYTGKLGVGVTEVTYTDQSVPLSQTGYLEICKQLASGTSSTITNVSSTAGSSTVTITTNSSPATFPSNLVGSTVSGADIPVGTVVDGETPTTLFLSQPATATSTTETLTFGSTSTIFTFSVNGQTVSVPAGACSPAIEVLAGSETVSETPVSGSGYAIVGCSTIPASNCAPVGDTVTVTVAAGGVSDETILTVTNGKLLWFTNNGDSSLGAINPTTGAVSNYTGTGISSPCGIALGPDGNLWFTNQGSNSIGEINPTTGAVSNYTAAGIDDPTGITDGPDGNLWFTNVNNSIGRITTAGVVTIYTPTGSGIDAPGSITAGPDGNLWFTNYGNNSIGEFSPSTPTTGSNYTATGIDGPAGITAGPDGNMWFTNHLNGTIGEFSPGTPSTMSFYSGAGIDGATAITAGPDGNLWFTNEYNNSIGRITTAGTVTNYAPTGSGIDWPAGIITGPDGNLWFTNYNNNSLGRITTAGAVTNYAPTGSGIVNPEGITAGP